MQIFLNSTRDIINVFKKFQDPETLAFDRTEIMVALSKFNEERLVSRSQAVRILRNLERFKVVTLDFHKVEFVGQGFVEQVFRVFQNAHPGIEIRYINANEDVEFMIKRGFATR